MQLNRKHRLKKIFLPLLVTVFVAVLASLFLSSFPTLLLFSFFPLIITGIQILGGSPLGFIASAVATMIGIFFLSGEKTVDPLLFSIDLSILWGGVLLLHAHLDHLKDQENKGSLEIDEMLKKERILRKEVEFYEQRKQELGARSEQRKKLSDAARILGSQLEPAAIQEKLFEATQRIFSGRFVQITVGQDPDQVDQFVIERKHSVLIPSREFKGEPLMAAPIMAEGAVAGVLRVGGEQSGTPFDQDDMRTLEVLASLASSSLDNTTLFMRVQEKAIQDHLTGLWTHKAFVDQLEAEILNASRYHQHFSILLLDVDHFKAVNDTHGHQAGDHVLQGLSKVLSRNLRDVDFAARYGGEEFAAILVGSDQNEAVVMAEKIRVEIERYTFSVPGKNLAITGSFGVATFPQDATSAQQMIRKVDERLYQAKKAGRNRVFGSRVGG